MQRVLAAGFCLKGFNITQMNECAEILRKKAVISWLEYKKHTILANLEHIFSKKVTGTRDLYTTANYVLTDTDRPDLGRTNTCGKGEVVQTLQSILTMFQRARQMFGQQRPYCS